MSIRVLLVVLTIAVLAAPFAFDAEAEEQALVAIPKELIRYDDGDSISIQ